MKDDFLLGLINPIIALIFSVTFLIFWTRDKERHYTLKIALSYFLMGCGFLAAHLIPIGQTLLNITSTNIVFATAAILLVCAVSERIEQKPAIREMIILSAVGVTLGFIFQMTTQTLTLSLLTVNVMIGSIFAIGAWHVRANRHKGGIETVIFWLFVLVAFQFFIRPVITFSTHEAIIPLNYRQSEYWVTTNFTAALFSVVCAMIFIAACTNDFIEQIKQASNTDLLTGLKVRKAFDEECQGLLLKHARTPLPLTMIVTDIDHFKRVNDAYGHQCGDMVISAFGKLITQLTRKTDLAGRIGGEEFCIILWNADEKGGMLIAESLRSALCTIPIDNLPEHERVSASFGVSTYRQGETFLEWFARTDRALYMAKNSGRNCVKSTDTHQVPSIIKPSAKPNNKTSAHPIVMPR